MNIIKSKAFVIAVTIFLLAAIPVTTYVVIQSDQNTREPQAATLCESNCSTNEKPVTSVEVKEDLNSDGLVDGADLSIVLSAIGKKGKNVADLNNDGVVNESDMTLVKAKWSK